MDYEESIKKLEKEIAALELQIQEQPVIETKFWKIFVITVLLSKFFMDFLVYSLLYK